jgi:hypothetical protein
VPGRGGLVEAAGDLVGAAGDLVEAAGGLTCGFGLVDLVVARLPNATPYRSRASVRFEAVWSFVLR